MNIEDMKRQLRDRCPPDPTFFIGDIPVYVIEDDEGMHFVADDGDQVF